MTKFGWSRTAEMAKDVAGRGLAAAGLALWLAGAGWAAAGPGGKAQAKPQPATQPGGPASYALGPGDVLAITVWNEPNVSGTVPVRPDGKISLPLVGDVEATGITPEKLQAILTTKLEAYIDHPEVTVVVQQVRSRTFNILGAVGKPGVYPLDKPTTVLDAIALAGGLAQFAKQNKIYVLRRKADGSRWTYKFDYKNVIRGHEPWENIELLPNDTVVVPS